MKKGLVFGLVMLMVLGLFTAVTAEEKAAEWTFMVFLNADNNLDSYGVSDLNEMETVGSTDKVNIVTLMDREHGPANIYYVKKDNTSAIKSEIVKSMGEMDMGDYKEMVKFVKFCKDKYPAKKYCLVVWNHGSGWKKKTDVFKGLSYDDSSNNHMTTPQLGTGLKQIEAVLGQKLDIFSNDACLMGMLEISAEVYPYCNYFVASEETEPGDGYGYHYILPSLVKNPTQSAATFAKKMVTGYAESYSSSYSSTTQSAVDQAKVPALIKVVESFGTALENAVSTDAAAIKAAHSAAQKFYYKDNVDMIHFAELLADKATDAKLKSAAKAVVTAGNAAVLQNNITGYKTKNAKGIALYMPTYSMSSAYKGIALGKTAWVKGIAGIIAAYKAAGKEEKPVIATSPYNLEYPGIVAQALEIEMANGNFNNFDALMASEKTDDVLNTMSLLKTKIGTEVLRGNEQLKGVFNQLRGF